MAEVEDDQLFVLKRKLINVLNDLSNSLTGSPEREPTGRGVMAGQKFAIAQYWTDIEIPSTCVKSVRK
jgi:hypothetical protein